MGGGGGEGAEVIGGDERLVTVNIRCSNGDKFTVETTLASSVDTFKAVLTDKCDVPANQQRLIYKGRILKDDQTLHSYGLEADHTVHLVRGLAPPASSNPPPTATNVGPPNSAPRSAPASNEGGALGGPGLGASLFPGVGLDSLGGTGSGLFGAGGLPEFEQVQQQLAGNPNIMREIMNMPAVQSLMNNPEIMRNFIMNNPQMREIIDRNPELGHILNDPSTLRQTLEAARNPDLMREMMRNTDRAMSNIESSPEGFNMLRRMYETVQEPFLNATTMAGNAANDSTNPFAALLGSQAGNQPRDGLTNPSSTNSDNSSPAPNINPLPNPWSAPGSGGNQTDTTRSSTHGDVRPPPAPASLGGPGLSDMDSMLGSMPDATLITQLMQNPAVSQMMQGLLSNPQYMNQILGMNPQVRSLLDSNSQLRDMIQNPEFLRQLTSPETMQHLLTLQQSFMSQLGRQQSTAEPGQAGAGAGTGTSNMGLDMLMGMFNGLGAGGPAAPTRPNVPPEELYETQLSQLHDMGFIDTQENIRALMATAGDIHAAVERLLGNLGQ